MEELKTIVEMLQGMTNTALWGFIAYLVTAKIVVLVLGWSGGIALACILSKRICELVSNYSACIQNYSACVQIVKTIRNMANLGGPGELTDSEVSNIQNVIGDIVSAWKEKQSSLKN